MDATDPSKLQNDGMPRISPRRKKTKDYMSISNSNSNAYSHMMAAHIEIEMHRTTTTLFEETDPFRFTSEPSSAPSSTPTSSPSGTPSAYPSTEPSASPTQSFPPTKAPTASPSVRPTAAPTYSVAEVPRNPRDGYFNYDASSSYGPNRWKNVNKLEKSDPGYFWQSFDMEGIISNECGSGKKQSPIDVCVKPRESCTETHEMRPKSGDYKMDSDFITKQILSNKLRLVMAPRTGEEPDPPQIDFSSNGRGIIDMTNIDFKFPSEHTVCGHKFDGEMQYFTYHPARKRFVAVSFFLDASETNPRNEHLQEVIEAFRIVYEEDERKCKERSASSGNSFANGFASSGNGKRNLYNHDNATMIMRENDKIDGLGLQQEHRHLALKWHPFHPDIQKTVHFWGYSGSLTDPPCTSDSVDWKIMDVPTPISPRQLEQLKHILFTHVDGNCKRTSVHNSNGSVARPTQDPQKYYKCTRDDYVSDEERAVCGDEGCVNPFGSGLNPYYPPLVYVTGPPTRSPSK